MTLPDRHFGNGDKGSEVKETENRRSIFMPTRSFTQVELPAPSTVTEPGVPRATESPTGFPMAVKRGTPSGTSQQTPTTSWASSRCLAATIARTGSSGNRTRGENLQVVGEWYLSETPCLRVEVSPIKIRGTYLTLGTYPEIGRGNG